MPIVFDSKPREWVSLESQMTNLSKYNGKILVPSGALVGKGELDDGQYPQHCQRWPYNSYVSDAVVKEQIKKSSEELKELSQFIDKQYGKGKFAKSQGYIETLLKNN